MHEKYWCAGVHTKFRIARCRLNSACVILAHAVCAHIILVHVVFAILTKRRGFLLVHTQCELYVVTRQFN
jgi:hypothetical protein